MALTNHSVSGVRTVYLPCRADRGFISSRFVREIARYGGAIAHMVPPPVAEALTSEFPTEHDLRRRLRRRRLRRVRRDRRRVPGAGPGLRRRRRDVAAPLDRHHRHRAHDAAVVVAAHRPRRDHRAARGGAAAPARRAAPGPLDAQGAPGVRRQDPARGRRAARGRPRAGRAHGAAHRGRAGRRAAGPPGDGDGRGRRPAPAPRDRGLPRPAPRQLRDPARQAAEDGRAPAASGCRSVPRPPPTNDVDEDDPTKGFFDQDR